MKKFYYIDLAKTITMFLVIICHCLLFFANNPYWAVLADYQNDVVIFLWAGGAERKMCQPVR